MERKIGQLGIQPTGRQPVGGDEDRSQIKTAGEELFGGYRISWKTLFSTWELSLCRFLFDPKYEDKVKDEFYDYMEKTCKSKSFTATDLRARIVSIPKSEMSQERKKQLTQILDKKKTTVGPSWWQQLES